MSPGGGFTARFFVDETSLGLGKALAIARRDVVHPGHAGLPGVPTGTVDPVWMPVVATMGLVVISRDRHIKSKPAELAAFRDHGLRAFWLAGKKDLTTWGYLVRIVRRWDDIEREIDSRGAGPWFCAIYDGTIGEVPIP